MAESVNVTHRPVESLIMRQKRDQISSLTLSGNTDLGDLEIDKFFNVTFTMNSDYRKENVINTSVTPTDGNITLSILHGTNGTTNNSVLSLNYTELASLLSSLDASINLLGDQIIALQTRCTNIESRLTAGGL